MQRYDVHVHMDLLKGSADDFVARLEKGGMTGANVLSVPPTQYIWSTETAEYEERITSLLAITSKYPDKLFPSLFVHPDEDGILSKVEDAVGRGVMGFKMMCSNYFVYEDKSMRLMEKIAKLGKPILFHSGILWDGMVSSGYNKPINWECCLEIPGLKFALAHCSWPWIDECIALYGKILNNRMKWPDKACEMFIDMTPGTPAIYRKELITKLHFIGYGLETNVMYGSDCLLHNYDPDFAADIYKMDDAIYDELGIGEDKRELIYEKNFLRFMGVDKK